MQRPQHLPRLGEVLEHVVEEDRVERPRERGELVLGRGRRAPRRSCARRDGRRVARRARPRRSSSRRPRAGCGRSRPRRSRRRARGRAGAAAAARARRGPGRSSPPASRRSPRRWQTEIDVGLGPGLGERTRFGRSPRRSTPPSKPCSATQARSSSREAPGALEQRRDCTRGRARGAGRSTSRSIPRSAASSRALDVELDDVDRRRRRRRRRARPRPRPSSDAVAASKRLLVSPPAVEARRGRRVSPSACGLTSTRSATPFAPGSRAARRARPCWARRRCTRPSGPAARAACTVTKPRCAPPSSTSRRRGIASASSRTNVRSRPSLGELADVVQLGEVAAAQPHAVHVELEPLERPRDPRRERVDQEARAGAGAPACGQALEHASSVASFAAARPGTLDRA